MTAVKESSDELNPPVATAAAVTPGSRPARSAKDYLALAIATCGVGYLPYAPGTWGSLLAVGLYLLLRFLLLGYPRIAGAKVYAAFLTLEWVAILAITALGIWAASRSERLWATKDPQKVVVDEVAGQMIALSAVPLLPDYFTSWLVLGAFLLFRFFDIVKPYPARRFESLKGGWGIMADDLVAGVYAALGVALIRWIV